MTLDPIQRAIQCLTTGAAPGVMRGRERERQCIVDFWTDCVGTGTSGSLYISGKPGTGKTATLREVRKSMESRYSKTQQSVAYLNCMGVGEPRAFFRHLLGVVAGPRVAREGAADPTAALDSFFQRPPRNKATKKKTIVLIVDEVDQLATRDNAVLYRLFSWPRRTNSRLVLVAIANALDLTERILPMLHRWECPPAVLNFEPYTREQLVTVITQRLHDVKAAGTLDAAALGLCAAKVTSSSGDLRQALDLCRRVLEITYAAKQRQAAAGGGGGPPVLPQIATMAGLFRAGDGVERLRDLPLHQRLLLCALVRAGPQGREISFGTLMSAYESACRTLNLDHLRTGLYDLCAQLACSALVRVVPPRGKKADKRDAKVRLAILQQDVETAFKSSPVMAKLFV